MQGLIFPFFTIFVFISVAAFHLNHGYYTCNQALAFYDLIFVILDPIFYDFDRQSAGLVKVWSRIFGQITTFKATTFFAHIFITATKIAGPNFSVGVTVARRGCIAFLPLGFFLMFLVGLEFLHGHLMVLVHLDKALRHLDVFLLHFGKMVCALMLGALLAA